jgi:AraC-like DNA-binding protein
MLLYLAVLIILLSIILIIYNWNENKNSLYLGGFLFLIAIYALSHYFTAVIQNPFWLAIFYGNFAPFNLLTGPFLYFYIRGNIRDSYSLSRSDIWHLIPFLISLAGLLPYITSPFSEKLALAEIFVKDLSVLLRHEIDILVPLRVNFVMRPTLLMCYSAYSVLILYRFRLKSESQLRHFALTFRWLYSFLTLTLISAVTYLYFSYGFVTEEPSLSFLKLSWATGIMGFTLLATGIFLLIFPQILYGFPIELKNESLINKPTKNQDESEFDIQFHELGDRIKSYFESEKPYLNPEFSLLDLAQNLHVPQHHISYCFRFVFNQGFPSMKSAYRIAHAKKLIENPANDYLSYEGIGLESGFSTRSRFYAAFQEIEGCSPGEYREKWIEKRL